MGRESKSPGVGKHRGLLAPGYHHQSYGTLSVPGTFCWMPGSEVAVRGVGCWAAGVGSHDHTTLARLLLRATSLFGLS